MASFSAASQLHHAVGCAGPMPNLLLKKAALAKPESRLLPAVESVE
jgi:hypothetical protein